MYSLAESKIFLGITMIIMNYGSKYVVNDITKYHDYIMQSTLSKKIVLFCMCFVATRDIMTSIILTFTITLIIDVLMNEKSKFSLLPYAIRKHFLASAHL
jgi:hypothetical protein